MEKTLTVQQFFARFGDDDACLEHLMKTRFGEVIKCPKCGKESKFHRVKNLPAYGCNCGHHIHPMVGTPFEDSHTPLQKWFYAMYLFTTSRHGVPAKELQRQLGVTYKTAWRMANQIRKYMGQVDGDGGLGGHVEADETYVGGRRIGGKRGRGAGGKTPVFGMVERGGKIMTRVVPNVARKTLEPLIEENVALGSTMSTDEMNSYWHLSRSGYNHGVVHHGSKQYVNGIHHVNSLEGFWSQIKRSIRGTHIHVSKKHLPTYLGEFEFRYNLRSNPGVMLSRLLFGF